VLNWTNNPRNVNRTRWLDVGSRAASATADTGDERQQSFWDWLGSWFSWDAWQKWWNS
jgi:hypothetical protein